MIHCHPLSLAVILILPLLFAIGLAMTTLAGWKCVKRFPLTLTFLLWIGYFVGTNVGKQWPKETRKLDPHKPYSKTKYPSPTTGVWLLESSIIGKKMPCLVGRKFIIVSVKNLTCLGQKFYNSIAQKAQWWGTPDHFEPDPPCLTSLIFDRPETVSVQPSNGRPQVDCTRYVEGQLIQYFP